MNKSVPTARLATQDSMTKAGAEALASSETVTIPGFGIFSTKLRPAPSPQSPYRREYRHHCLKQVLIQGRQNPSRPSHLTDCHYAHSPTNPVHHYDRWAQTDTIPSQALPKKLIPTRSS